ncbi:MAG: PorT family protein [Bdellovibrionales bacterium]|nr:PorT family protein [Bdellovibrionales bacterium]
MKKFRFSVLVVLVLMGSFWTRPSSAFSLGLQGGLHLANDSTGLSSQTRFMFGGRLELPLFMNLFLQTELNYLNYGTSEFLGVPVLGKVKIEARGFSPYLLIGPEFGFKVSGSNLINGSNFSIDFGLGAEFEVAPMALFFIDGRYSLGTTNYLGTVKTRSVQILAGLAFAI